MHPADFDDRLAAAYRGRRWIVVSEVAAAAGDLVNQLRARDAAEVMVVAGAEGVGALPDGVPVWFTRTRGSSVMEGIRSFLASIERPSAELVQAVDGFDPDGRARVIGTQFLRVGEAAGRPVYGGRTEAWAALEDKTTVDALWDRAGVARAPVAVVPVAAAAAAASQLAGPRGTVWTADNRDGWHGGAEYTRWVPGPADSVDAAGWFAGRADRVRVMPFLEGIPCSIHAFVTADGIATFRPVEMVILHRRDPPAFVYAGTASFWDPPAEIRRTMRAVARAVAAEVRASVGYRGGFSIDGVCTSSGFLPTELNPRLSPGLEMQARVAGVPLNLANAAYLAGDLDVSTRRLETRIVPLADARRTGGMGLSIPDDVPPAETGLRFTADAAFPAEPGAEDALLEVGPSVSGSYVRMALDPERIEPGPSVGRRAVAAAELAARLWEFQLPELVPAVDRCESHAK